MRMKTELHFLELPNKSMFWLKKDFWKKLYDLKRKEKMNWKKIANKLEINSGTLSNYVSQFTRVKKAQYIPLKNLLKISKFLGIPHEKVENWIMRTKYGKNGKPIQISFPINFMTTKWAGLVGAVLSDGYATKHDVCEITKLSEKWVERLLKRSFDEGYTKIIGGGEGLGISCGKASYFYVSGE